MLAQDPSLCGNATKLADALNNDKNKQMAVGMGAIVVGAVATGGLGSVLGAGALASSAASSAVALTLSHGAIYAPDYAKYQDAKQRGFSAAHTVDGKSTANKAIGDVKDFEEARDTLAMDFATLPLDFAGFGIYKGLATGGKSLALGAKDLSALAKMKIWDKPLAKAAAKNALTKSGLSELQALKVLADLKSADGVAAGRALTQLAKVLDIDTGEVKIMQNLYRTGIVPEVDTRASSRALARLRSIPAEQRAVTLNRVEDSLANLNTAKINAGNRDQVMETIIAGNQFGADPKRIASVVTDWDTGLDGLARTYDVARKKMDLPEVRGLASVEAKQEAAFGKALDELMEANPEFKALKSEDKLAAKNQMMGCGLKGK
ncbi:MAG: hypothetical protein EOP11_13395 [Proteobacteria bacterium]|nr:MAG: hypothetical protein EOP11_13395 [Pseudomonadota bacterium]